MGVIERCGQFRKLADPGCHCLNPFLCEKQRGHISMRVMMNRVRCETKTKDNVFVIVECSVQYQVIDEPLKIQEAFYKLTNPKSQIEAYVYDVVRATVPKINLDDVFIEKDHISQDIQETLAKTMLEFGYRIIATPITDIDPAKGVKKAMNSINKNQRLRDAAADEGEAAKIKAVKKAEAVAASIRIEAAADADAKHKAGEGLSRQRQAIIDGLTESVKLFQDGIGKDKVDSRTVMDLIMITQYFDMMKDVGERTKSNIVFTPGNDSNIGTQMRQAIMEGQGTAWTVN